MAQTRVLSGRAGKGKKVGFGAASTRRFVIADGNVLHPVRRR